jgi:hypothetical protein
MADAREIAARFVDAFNAHDEARISELNHENAVFEGPGDVRLDVGRLSPSTPWRG